MPLFFLLSLPCLLTAACDDDAMVVGHSGVGVVRRLC
jgi:hypothetical protein